MNILKMNDYKKGSYLQGEAVCLHCNHTWNAILDMTDNDEVPELECPKCKFLKGVFCYLVLPKENDLVFLCSCGCYVGYHGVNGFVCCLCGQVHDIDDIRNVPE